MSKYKIDFEDLGIIEETWELILQSREGDNRATTKLVVMYSDYIEYMVKKYSSRTYIKDDDDLRSVIYIGFLEGIKRYDPEKKTKFIYFTHNWMKKLIFSESNKYFRLIRLPVNQSNFKAEFNKKYPNVDDLDFFIHAGGDILKSPIYDPDYIKYRRLRDTETSNFIDKKFYSEEFDNTLYLENALVADSQLERKENNSRLKFNINRVLGKFSSDEVYVLEHLFGLNNNLKISTDQIAVNLCTSKVNIINIKNKMIRMLRHNMFKNILFNGL